MLAEKRIERDLSALQNNLSKLLGDFKDLAKAEIGDGVERLEHSKAVENLQHGISQLQQSYNRTRDMVQSQGKKAKDLVEEHPFWAVMGALGVGLMLGKFLMPHRR